MDKIIPHILLILLFLGCKNSSDSTDRIHNYTKPIVDRKASHEPATSNGEIQSFSDWMENSFEEIELNNDILRSRLRPEIVRLTDRLIEFQYKSKELILNKYGQKSYQRPSISIFQFKNKQNCNKATELLLNCFSSGCRKLTVGKPEGMKITPSIYLLSDLEICIMKISCENDIVNWDQLKTEFLNFANANTTIIEAECGKIKWLN